MEKIKLIKEEGCVNILMEMQSQWAISGFMIYLKEKEADDL